MKRDDLQIVYKPTDSLIPYARNARTHSDDQVTQIASSIKEFGFNNPILLDGENGVIAGHGRLMAAKKLGLDFVPCVELTGMTETQKRAYILADNRIAEKSGWDFELVKVELAELEAEGFDIGDAGIDFDGMFTEDEQTSAYDLGDKESKGVLRERYIPPPFSVLDTRKGAFLDRTRYWNSLGLRSELGRGENLTYEGALNQSVGVSGTSVFNPTLCEVLMSWFSPVGGVIVDPFSGGAVRGVVAAKLGRRYIGNDLRQEQVSENQRQWSDDITDKMCLFDSVEMQDPVWHCGDSVNIDKYFAGIQADFVFSCPPYADLEVYSDDEKDLSNMDYEDFLVAYRQIIQKSVDLLKPDSFACFVVSEVRSKGKNGEYYGFVHDTIKAFEDAGCQYYNELILINPVGSGCLRAGPQFDKSRKIARHHQNILVFVKGDAKKATENCGHCEVADIGNEECEDAKA